MNTQRLKADSYILILGDEHVESRKSICDAACNYLTTKLIVYEDKFSNICYSHKIVCTGSSYTTKNKHISQIMKDYLVAGGLPEDSIIIEDKTKDAISSIIRFKNMLIENNIIGSRTFGGFVKEIMICSPDHKNYNDYYVITRKIFENYNIKIKGLVPLAGRTLSSSNSVIKNIYNIILNNETENIYDETTRPENMYDETTRLHNIYYETCYNLA